MSTTREMVEAYYKKREKGELKSNPNSTRGMVEAYYAKRNYANIGKDIIDINNAITDAYSGWKDADTMGLSH